MPLRKNQCLKSRNPVTVAKLFLYALSLVRDRVFFIDEGGAGGNSVDFQALELGLGRSRRNAGFLLGVVGVTMGAVECGVKSRAGAVGSTVALAFFPVLGATASDTDGVAFDVGAAIVGIGSGLGRF